MALDLRQEHFLAQVVESYVQTAAPVGSRALSRHGGESMSPAGIRAVLASLEAAGCIFRPHRSAGRVPTDRGYRYYVDRLMTLVELPAHERARLAEAATEAATPAPQGLAAVVRDLAKLLHQLTVGIVADGGHTWVVYSGTRHIAEQPEFATSVTLAPIFGLLDDSDALRQVLHRLAPGDQVTVTIGHENALEPMHPCALAGVRLDGHRMVAVLGPTRLDYPLIMSRLAECRDLIHRASEERTTS